MLVLKIAIGQCPLDNKRTFFRVEVDEAGIGLGLDLVRLRGCL